ncbi:MAG TPA: response regulator transcription factor [Gemmatimonadaceae bacterium]|nr:response regulator transcription factor [Gemmatimonadaceae bacterium]
MPIAQTATKKPLRVLLLEDDQADAALISHELQRTGMRILLAQVDSADSFTAALRNFVPDVVLSDHSLGQFDSRAALEVLRAVRPTAPFIIVTGNLTGSQAGAAIRAGAEDVILKTNMRGLEASISNALSARRRLHALTDRQIQVLRLVAEGHRTREIAKQLGLSIKTIESHRSEIMKRIRIHDVVSLVRFAIRVGLIPAAT